MSDQNEMPTLAVVIPAYKAAYFNKALGSLANQTVKNFSVYVGDDHSPEDLKAICDKFSDVLTVHYTRFPNNIGSKNLVNQWNRCIGLTKGENWLWLFSDDDLADPNCVERFFETLVKNGNRYDVYRFNTTVIDKDDKVLAHTPQGPAVESSAQMAYYLLLAQRGNSMPDHIFSRNVYEKNGGFVFTCYAQAADWASSILFSREKGICIIPEAKLFWRMSGTNISSVAAQKKGEMLKGHLQFMDWLIPHFQYLKKGTSNVTFEMIRQAAVVNLRSVIVNHYKGLDAKNTRTVFRLLRRRLNLSPGQALKEILLIKKRSSPLLSKLFFRVRNAVSTVKP